MGEVGHYMIAGVVAAFAFERMKGSKIFGDNPFLQKVGPYGVAGLVLYFANKIAPSAIPG